MPQGQQRGGPPLDPAVAEKQRLQREAQALSFFDNFWRLAWICAAVIPFALLLGRRPPSLRTPATEERAAAAMEA